MPKLSGSFLEVLGNDFQALQPLLAVFGCLFCFIYWLEVARKYGFGTSNK